MKRVVFAIILAQFFTVAAWAEPYHVWQRTLVSLLATGVVAIDAFGAYYADKALKDMKEEDSTPMGPKNLAGAQVTFSISAALLGCATLSNAIPNGGLTLVAGIFATIAIVPSVATTILVGIEYDNRGDSHSSMLNTFGLSLGGIVGHLSTTYALARLAIRAGRGENMEVSNEPTTVVIAPTST